MTDAYEREYMPGLGAVLHRQKVHPPRWAVGIAIGLPFALAAIASVGLAIAGAPILATLAPILGGTLYAALMSGVMAVFASGRIAISEGEIYVQIGLAGPRVAMKDVLSCELGPSGIRRMGLAARKQFDGTTIYSLMGDNARAVHIRRRNGPPIVLVCPEPEIVLRAIEEACARLEAGAAPKTRVDVAEDEAAEAEAEAEASERAARR